VFGAGLVITTRKINESQAEEPRQFQFRIEGEQQKTANAQRDAAEVQLALKRYVDDVAEKERAARLQIDRKVGPRHLTSDEEAKLKSQLAAFSDQSIDIFGFRLQTTTSVKVLPKQCSSVSKNPAGIQTCFGSDPGMRILLVYGSIFSRVARMEKKRQLRPLRW
jgi:hypothetical protein